MFARIRPRLSVAAIVVLAFVAFSSPAYANHSWDDYHWARENNPFTVPLQDNVGPGWDRYLETASDDWSESDVLNTEIAGGGPRREKCGTPKNGRVRVCNGGYGRTGWLGLARIWVRGDHIARGQVKLNNTYFKRPRYDTPEWRNLVTCQEVGHTLGLDHQDEDFDNPNLGSCMDYTRYPGGNPRLPEDPSNEHPNRHDLDQLRTIYAHTDPRTTVGNDRGGQGRGRDPLKEYRFVVPVEPPSEHAAEGEATGEAAGEGFSPRSGREQVALEDGEAREGSPEGGEENLQPEEPESKGKHRSPARRGNN
jgi:hypothetical protein